MFLNNTNFFSNSFNSIVYRRDLMFRDSFSFSFSFFLNNYLRFEFFELFSFLIRDKNDFYIRFN